MGAPRPRAMAARDVAPGAAWPFLEHRTMAEVIAEEEEHEPRGCGAPDCELPWEWREDADGRWVLVPPRCWACH